MTEDEARSWILDRFGGAGFNRMEKLITLLRDASHKQNLVASSTIDTIWARHIVDSAQLIFLAEDYPGRWIDIGTGAGFPGLVVAALTQREIWMVEPRKRRTEFLAYCCSELGLGMRSRTTDTKIERVDVLADVISARAVASLSKLFSAAAHCSTWNTVWILPKGSSAYVEVEKARQCWHGSFHVEQSVTNADSIIVVAKEVLPK